ncbi:carbon-nitrogen hydrolase family protein, partial [Nocardia tengchongensis]
TPATLGCLGLAMGGGPGVNNHPKPGSMGARGVAAVDIDAEVERARRVLRHLEERRVDAYHNLMTEKSGY